MLSNILTIDSLDFEKLNQLEATELIAKLLWAECTKLNIPITDLTIPFEINIPDGGIDAKIDTEVNRVGDLIRDKRSFYQIKSGKNFKPSNESDIKKELFGEKVPCKENLGKMVRKCLDENGTYILICSGNSKITSENIVEGNKLLKKFFIQCGYKDIKTLIIEQSSLRGIIETHYPAIAFDLKKMKISFKTHSTWNKTDQMKKYYLPSINNIHYFEDIKKKLRCADNSIHIRIVGEPGIGKTRFALEVTRSKDLSPLVIYCESAKTLDKDLLERISLDDNKFIIILVVDECDINDSARIWDQFKHLGSRIKLITIFTEKEKRSGTTEYVSINPLDEKEIATIISSYGIPQTQADKYARSIIS